MNIKRFFAPDIRQAIRKVREEQGPDAVILSNTRVNGGVEIVAAVDYDETMFGTQFDQPGSGREQAPQVTAEARSESGSETGSEPRNEPARHTPREQYGPEGGESPQQGRSGSISGNIWSQEPTLLEMRAELNSLRRMLESQLSSLAWGDFVRHEPLRVELVQRLLQFGLTAAQAKEIAQAVTMNQDVEKMWHHCLALVANRIPIYEHDVLNDGGIVALVGPTGVGKTTTAAKLAARYALRHGSRHVALVTIDNHRVGAYEQLRTYGRILDVPVKVAGTREELRKVLQDLCDRRLVLIDTAGMGQHDSSLARQAEVLDRDDMSKKCLLLLSATTRQSGMTDVVDAFRVFDPDGCVLTKTDEATCLGGALSVSMQHELPIAYISDGQRVPEDLHTARAHGLVTKGVDIMNKAGSAINDDLVALSFGKEVANACF